MAQPTHSEPQGVLRRQLPVGPTLIVTALVALVLALGFVGGRALTSEPRRVGVEMPRVVGEEDVPVGDQQPASLDPMQEEIEQNRRFSERHDQPVLPAAAGVPENTPQSPAQVGAAD
ncbi:MAG: hypothetical protein IT204_08690 [Fimbriimonadaceae bacterium]|nr:hypothetical protein [Fimbriimonadaceae bacterium]